MTKRQKKRWLAEVIAHFETRFDLDLRCDDLRDIHAVTSALRHKECMDLIAMLAATAEGSERYERLRVAAVKLAVVFLPESRPLLLRWLDPQCPLREVQFTLFCFLDDVPHLGNDRSFARDIPVLVGEFLQHVPTNTAEVAWMAGDLLGDHWDLRASLPILLRLARQARFAAGRSGAVHGIACAARRTKSVERLRDMRSVLALIKNHERSHVVRESATAALGDVQRRLARAHFSTLRGPS